MGKNVVLKKEVQSRLCLECRWDRGGERAGTPGFEWDHLRIRQSAIKLQFLKSCFCFHDGTLPLQGLHSITSISILQECREKDQVNYVFIFSFEPTIPPLLWSSCCWWLLTPFLYISRRGSSWLISILPLHAFFANFLLKAANLPCCQLQRFGLFLGCSCPVLIWKRGGEYRFHSSPGIRSGHCWFGQPGVHLWKQAPANPLLKPFVR